MSDRFTPLNRDDLDESQRAVYDAIQAGPRGSVPWIFHLYLQSPDLAAAVQQLGAFCRYRTGLAGRLSELAILVVAKHWSAEYEWSVHEGEARKAGLPDCVIAAIAAGTPPDFGSDSEAALVYDFTSEYLAANEVSDPLFARAVDTFGRRTVVELAGIIGYYSMLAMAIRIFRLPPAR
jgi:4-carboxymuconolactone decarboxylase